MWQIFGATLYVCVNFSRKSASGYGNFNKTQRVILWDTLYNGLPTTAVKTWPKLNFRTEILCISVALCFKAPPLIIGKYKAAVIPNML